MYDINIKPSSLHTNLQQTIIALSHAQATESNKQAFMQSVEEYMYENHYFDLFEKIVSYRVNEIHQMQDPDAPRGNLYTTLTSPLAQTITGVKPINDLPSLFLYIERTAIAFYGDILMCWAEFKAFQINQQAKRHLQAHYDEQCPPTSSEENVSEMYRYEVVEDIRNDERLFLTSHSLYPMTLSLANVLINLETFVKQQHWYEMLYYLDISASGEHFILYQDIGGEAPLLLSSALIQRYEQHDNWLTFDPFFQTDSWTLTLSNEKISTLEQSGIFSNRLKSKLNMQSVEKFDYSLLRAVTQKQAVCEIIRMAISGPREKLNHVLYLTLKYLTLKLADIGLEVAYTIVEQPSILGFYQSVNNDSKNILPYVALCQQQVAGTALTTYQGVVFTGPMSQAFEENSFRDYNKRIISMRKLARASANA
ncbi:N-(3-hydroxybutanoyl)-L- homoserine lactone synthase LuxM [Grimontia indica]|uniref:acyl-homoserine-lactone synthase n=1 Tax=Grimontia indica TaxID=1056512 RepID=R1I9V8_9GAMM|nr:MULTISPECIES: acyl-homoserine-lactone synthase [Grimontia]EOD77491.1 N-(3-hydroxybutanoyl)-L- homoserine lactone synthase LuxM [Grimontia indica]